MNKTPTAYSAPPADAHPVSRYETACGSPVLAAQWRYIADDLSGLARVYSSDPARYAALLALAADAAVRASGALVRRQLSRLARNRLLSLVRV